MEKLDPHIGDVLKSPTTGIARRVINVESRGEDNAPWVEVVEINSGIWSGWNPAKRMYNPEYYQLIERA